MGSKIINLKNEIAALYVGRGRTSLDQLRVLGPGRGEGRSFRKKKCGAPWRVPASRPLTLRAVPDWASPGIPEAPAPTPVWIVLGCRSVAAAQLVRGSHSLSARKPRASQAAATRPSERKTATWVAASSQCVVASLTRGGCQPGSREAPLGNRMPPTDRPAQAVLPSNGVVGGTAVVANSPALTVES